MKKSGKNLAKEVKKLMEENIISSNKMMEKINEFIKTWKYKMEEIEKGKENFELSIEEIELIAALSEMEEEQKLSLIHI